MNILPPNMPMVPICENCGERTTNKFKTFEYNNKLYIYTLCKKCNTNEIDWITRCKIIKER